MNIRYIAMNKEAVREYVEQSQKIIESSPQMDEANTKAAVLRDFLELLGWEIPANTQLEYSVKAFGKTYKVDYALVLEGAPVAFIEAKGVDTPLTDKHREQLRAYLKNEDVNLGILTNGEEYEFFRRQVVDSKVNVSTLTETQLQKLPDNVTILRAFTKGAIQTDEWLKILNRIRELREARATLENEKDNLAAEITKLFAETVSNSVSSLAESQAKEMIDRLIQDIEHEIDSDSTTSREEENDESAQSVPSENSPSVTAEYVLKIQDGENTLAIFADNNQSDPMAEAVDYLIKEHGLISKLEPLPYVPGNKNAIINDQPIHPDGERKMRTFRELSGGYYLYTSFNKRDKKRHVQRLADKCGFEVKSEGNW